MADAFLYDGLRTPFGRHGGALAHVRPDDLLADLIGRLVKATSFDPNDIEDVTIGCTNQAGEDSRNVARRAALMAGLPVSVAGQTVNRLCGSGLSAVIEGANSVLANRGNLFLAGGVESMTRAPFVISKSESAFSRSANIFDTVIGPRFSNPRQVSAYGDHQMPETGDFVASELGIERADCDLFALNSQQRYATAKSAGYFDAEVSPVLLTDRKGKPSSVSEDEHPRPSATLEGLASLSSLYEGGVVTAGNASGVNDGAAAIFVGSKAAGEKSGMRPLARIVSSAVAGVKPRLMGLGPVPASEKALARAGLELDQIDVIELNEAFASQVLGCLKLMKIPATDSRINVNGGAIAMGHPLGASGTRLALTAARQLDLCNGRYALVTMCIGVGQGVSLVLEREVS
ncbi:3-oxoadipyl-CoA thiolase [Mesorhizobium australicum]|uniref:3-oxoadipyl-CoA thiolase n=1 Tax=Mesorhizobium australicum TaxID=536018 RepID=UPI00333AFBE9